MFSGRLLDRIGTRAGLSLTVACYSTIAALTSLAIGLRSFAAFRFLLGAAESANWPGATKAVAEWFPPRESGWAVRAVRQRLVDRCRDRAGARLAIFISRAAGVRIHRHRHAGFLWVALFHATYRAPEHRPDDKVRLKRIPRTTRSRTTRSRRLVSRTGRSSACRRRGIVLGKR